MTPHRVLFVFMSGTDLAQMKHLARGLAGVGAFEAYSCALADGHQEFASGLPDDAINHRRPVHLLQFEQQRHAASGVTATASLRDYMRMAAKYEPLRSLRMIYGIAMNARYWRRRRLEAEQFLRENRIDSLITCNDTTLHYLPVLKAAQNMARPVILARSANIYYHDESDGCRNSVKHRMRARMPQMHVDKADSLAGWLVNWLVRRLFPNQIANTIWGQLVPYQPSDLLSLAIAGIRSQQLWHLGQDWTSYLVVSGDDEADALRSYGVPQERILAIGCVAFENVSALLHQRDRLRAEICGRLGLNPERPIILITVPAGWEHRMFTYEQQFSYLRNLFSILREHDAQVVLSLHPLSRRSDYEQLASDFSIKFLDRQLIDIIVFVDMFLGADNSSVLRWAMAAGLPTMNYQLNPDRVQFRLHPEYPNITTQSEFIQWLRQQLARSPIRTSELLELCRRPMGLIVGEGFFDRLALALEGGQSQRE